MALSLLWLLAIGDWLSAAPAPFLRLRETPLTYSGPEGDFTNLSEIRIGWFGPTNEDDPLTGDLWWAANLAIREANDQAGSLDNSSFIIRHSSFQSLPFRLVPRWAVDPWGTGVSQLTRMVYDEQPLALLGSVDSATTHLAEQVVAKANLPLVSPIATDPSVTLAGVPWMFSCAPSDGAIARVLVDDVLAALADAGDRPARSSRGDEALISSGGDAKEKLSLLMSAATERRNASRLALLTCTDHESRMITREVLKELSRRGRQPDFRFDLPPGTHDFAGQLAALTESRPAGILIIAGPEDAARLVCAVRKTQPLQAHSPGPSLFGSHAMGRARFRQLAGPASEGVRFPLLFAPTTPDADTARFTARFIAERGHPPDYTALLTYDATNLLLEAIRLAGPDRARVREAMAQVSPWAGIAGRIQFDGTGQNTRANLRMATIRNGALVPLPRASCPETTTNSTAKL